jgi:hypothetical protein
MVTSTLKGLPELTDIPLLNDIGALFQSAFPSISVIRRSFGHYGYREVTLSASINRPSDTTAIER